MACITVDNPLQEIGPGKALKLELRRWLGQAEDLKLPRRAMVQDKAFARVSLTSNFMQLSRIVLLVFPSPQAYDSALYSGWPNAT